MYILVSLMEMLGRCVDASRVRVCEPGLDVNLSELFAELKKLGPRMFLEVWDDEEGKGVKIWLE